MGFGLWELVTSCRAYAKSEDVEQNRYSCIKGAVFTVLAALALRRGYGEMSIALAKSLDTKARVTAGELLGELVEMHDWNLGPNVRNPNEFPRSVKLHRRMEDILTQQLGHEVRHIGMWNEPKLNPLSKRQEKQHPVFALQHGSQDLHIAIMDIDPITMERRVKLGYGPGPRTKLNERRLQSRDGVEKIYNQQYFDSGGLDAKAMMNSEINDLPEFSYKNLRWLYDEVACSIEIPSENSDYKGFQWNILDYYNRLIMAQGAIAAFGPSKEQESIIGWITYGFNLKYHEQCMVGDEWGHQVPSR
jgi:hypothetical protein